jgi:hypothetical protein
MRRRSEPPIKGRKPVHFRFSRALSAVIVASAFFLGLVPSASAGPKDKDAEKLLKLAIDEDYLNAEFPKAEKKLKDAVTKCGASGCSPELLGKIHIALGTVYGVGLSKPDEAKEEFTLALKADPNAALDPALSNKDLQNIFAAAKAGAGGGTTAPPPPKPPTPAGPPSGGEHTPPPESQVNTPVPIYVEPSDEVPLAKVVLKYKPFGETQYKSVELKKVGKGWGGEIPCDGVTTTGDIRYFFAYTGTDGEAAGSLGSSKEPFKTTIKNDLEGDPPRLPGRKPPDQCKRKEDCPPGLQGCPEAGAKPPTKHGDKPWGSSCDASEECKEGLSCVNGTCEEGKGGDDDKGEDKDKKKRMNLIGLGVQFDVLALKGSAHACDGSDPVYECYVHGVANTQFFGVPVSLGQAAKTDGIQAGGAFAGARILIGYDRQLVKKIGLSIGLRAGYAFGGPGAPSNLNAAQVSNPMAQQLLQMEKRPNPPQAGASAFKPYHVEVRATYHVLNSMMDDKKFRPYVFIGGGAGQVNGMVQVAVCDANRTTSDPTSGADCHIPSIPTILRNVDAYQLTGLGFVEFGVGTTFGITPLFGIAAEAKFMFMVPTFGFNFAPNIGPVFNF